MTGREPAAASASRKRHLAARRRRDDAARRTVGVGVWVVAFYIVLDYGKPQLYLPFLQYLKLGLWAPLLGTAVLILRRPHPLPREGKVILWILAGMAVVIPFSDNPRVAFNTVFTLLQMMLAGPWVLMTTVDDVRKLRVLLWTYVWVGALQVVQGILRGGTGIGGYFVDENDLCMLAATVAPIAYFLGSTASGVAGRVAGFTVLVLSVLSGVATFSRGGFLAMIAVGLYVVLRSRRPAATLAVIAVALILVYPLVPVEWYDEMKTIDSAHEYGDTGAVRIYMWKVAWKVFLHNPVLGVGANNLGRELPEFEDPRSGQRPLWGRACHSLYLTLLSETGVVGTALWAALLVCCFAATTGAGRRVKDLIASDATGPASASVAAGRQLFGACRGLEAAMVGFLAAGVFLTINYYPVMWTLVAFMSATRVVLANEPALSAAREGPRGAVESRAASGGAGTGA